MYEKDYKTAPAGMTLPGSYDAKKLAPTEEYVKIYDEAVKIMTDLGLTYWMN
jgi:methylamine--corrinoid protein Co-methyltransferase